MATMQTPRGRLLRKGSRGDDVRELQMKLHRLGFDLAADGVFGDDTERAVTQLQTLFGYTVDAIVGDGTMKLIEAQIGHHWNVQAPDAAALAMRAQKQEVAHTAELAGEHVAPGASHPAGGPGSTPSSTLPKSPPQGSPLKR